MKINEAMNELSVHYTKTVMGLRFTIYHLYNETEIRTIDYIHF